MVCSLPSETTDFIPHPRSTITADMQSHRHWMVRVFVALRLWMVIRAVINQHAIPAMFFNDSLPNSKHSTCPHMTMYRGLPFCYSIPNNRKWEPIGTAVVSFPRPSTEDIPQCTLCLIQSGIATLGAGRPSVSKRHSFPGGINVITVVNWNGIVSWSRNTSIVGPKSDAIGIRSIFIEF